MDAGRDSGSVVEDSVATEGQLEVVERLGGAVVGVDSGRSAIALSAIAPGVVGVGERGAHGRAVVQVTGAVVAVCRIDHRVTAATARGVERDLADVYCLARSRGCDTAHCGRTRTLIRRLADLDRCRDGFSHASNRAIVRVGHDDLAARRLSVGLHAGDGRLPSQDGLALARVDHEGRISGLANVVALKFVAGLL